MVCEATSLSFGSPGFQAVPSSLRQTIAGDFSHTHMTHQCSWHLPTLGNWWRTELAFRVVTLGFYITFIPMWMYYQARIIGRSCHKPWSRKVGVSTRRVREASQMFMLGTRSGPGALTHVGWYLDSVMEESLSFNWAMDLDKFWVGA